MVEDKRLSDKLYMILPLPEYNQRTVWTDQEGTDLKDKIDGVIHALIEDGTDFGVLYFERSPSGGYQVGTFSREQNILEKQRPVVYQMRDERYQGPSAVAVVDIEGTYMAVALLARDRGLLEVSMAEEPPLMVIDQVNSDFI